MSTTRARLQHLFGADYRFEFHRQQQGLAVLIGIPWHTANGDPLDEDVEQQTQANPPATRLRLRHGAAAAR